MSFHFFTVPTLDSALAQDELNAFCDTNRVVQVERHFVSDGTGSHWAVCVQTAPGPGPLPDNLKRRSTASGHTGGAEPRVDYKTVLSEPEFTRFAALRTLRKTLAEQEGVPLYAVFTNEQLAAMAKAPPRSLADVQAVEGVGPARVQRYGQPVLACLQVPAVPASDAVAP